jgi:hypothetical protein
VTFEDGLANDVACIVKTRRFRILDVVIGKNAVHVGRGRATVVAEIVNHFYIGKRLVDRGENVVRDGTARVADPDVCLGNTCVDKTGNHGDAGLGVGVHGIAMICGWSGRIVLVDLDGDHVAGLITRAWAAMSAVEPGEYFIP